MFSALDVSARWLLCARLLLAAVAIAVVFQADMFRVSSPMLRSLASGAVAVVLGELLAWMASGWRDGVRDGLLSRSLTLVAGTVLIFGDPFGLTFFPLRVAASIAVVTVAGVCGVAIRGALRRMRDHKAILFIFMTASVPAMAAPPNLDAAWAYGYAAYIQRFCPGWRADYLAVAKAGGSPDLAHMDDWAPEKPAARLFSAGAKAAEVAADRDHAFCADPLRTPPSRPLVSQFIHKEG